MGGGGALREQVKRMGYDFEGEKQNPWSVAQEESGDGRLKRLL